MSTDDKSRDVGYLKKYETAVKGGQSALRAFLTLNGGATIALLAFIGRAMETHAMPVQSGRVFVNAMQLFVFGTFLGVVAYGTIFLTTCFSSIDWPRSANVCFGLTVLFCFGSLGCFLWASSRAIEGFRLANEVLALPPK